MTSYLPFFIAFIIHLSVRGQNDSSAHYLELIGTARTVEERLAADSVLHRLMLAKMREPGAFDAPYEHLVNMGKLSSSDGKLRLINWNVPLKKGKHLYHCIVLVKDKKGGHVVFELRTPPHPERAINDRKVLTTEQWYGALYYEIIPVNKGAKTYYTLLGWSGNDRLSTRKVIDVLSISGKRLKLGAPIFQLKKQAQYRVVFEYSEEVRMGLGFEEDQQCIVYDNLTPISQDLEGQFQFYGPDGSYNALIWKNGKWMLDADIEVKGETDTPYNAPKQPDLNKLKK